VEGKRGGDESVLERVLREGEWILRGRRDRKRRIPLRKKVKRKGPLTGK